jgi:hypothetical protein
MPTKEYLISDLKERIALLEDYYNKMEEMGSTPIMLGIIAMKLYELQERVEELEKNV